MAQSSVQRLANSSYSTSRLRIGLGTFVAVEAEAGTERELQTAITAAFAAVARVESLMHPTRQGSDLERLRRAPTQVPVPVDEWTWQVLALCRRLNRLSRGIFDPCLPAAEPLGEPAGRFTDLELLPRYYVVRHANLRLDLGGVAKGFAVDRALDALRAGCRGGMVNAGGDLAVFGDRAHEIVLRPSTGHATLQLRNAALATSVIGGGSRPTEHLGYYNGVDGCEITAGSVSVTAPSAAIADALTKCVLMGDDALNAELLQAFGARRISL